MKIWIPSDTHGHFVSIIQGASVRQHLSPSSVEGAKSVVSDIATLQLRTGRFVAALFDCSPAVADGVYGENAWFLISGVNCVVFFLLPFLCVLPSLLSLTFQKMDLLRFQAGGRIRRPNLGLVCFVLMFAVFLVKDACLFSSGRFSFSLVMR